MAPTYFRREPGIDVSNGHRGSALSQYCASIVMAGLVPAIHVFDDGNFRRPGCPGTRSRMTEQVVSAPDTTVIDQKARLRQQTLALRDALPAADRAAAAEAIAGRAFPVRITPGIIVAVFSPMKSEINPVPLMRKLADAGAKLALPAIAGRGEPLIMRTWAFGEALASGQWGIREPLPEAPEVAPDILIVPLAAFDRAGHRIGYGAGYYDMTINALRAKKSVTAVGIGFAAQEVPSIPATERDARLDLVLTERETIDFRET
jgi:5-formyltetrahydrofolate cyclo-ligase